MIRTVYVPAPSRPERFTLLTPVELAAYLTWMAGIYAASLALFPAGG